MLVNFKRLKGWDFFLFLSLLLFLFCFVFFYFLFFFRGGALSNNGPTWGWGKGLIFGKKLYNDGLGSFHRQKFVTI